MVEVFDIHCNKSKAKVKRLCNGKKGNKRQMEANNLSLFQRLSSVALITKRNLCLITRG
jgi:hypothetical protein